MNKLNQFDWHSEKLNPSTKINSTYKNTQNVRRFFKQNIGEHFHFTRDFMKFMKENTGKTLSEAADEWKRMYE